MIHGWRLKSFLFVLACFFIGLSHVPPGWSASVVAAPFSQYFSVIQDLPLMPGLRELADQAVVFDQPEGRIIESAAISQGPVRPEIERFYGATLQALGWKAVTGRDAGLAYIREDEFLQINFEPHADRTIVRIMVGPAR